MQGPPIMPDCRPPLQRWGLADGAGNATVLGVFAFAWGGMGAVYLTMAYILPALLVVLVYALVIVPIAAPVIAILWLLLGGEDSTEWRRRR